jgi:molybdopterin converting factor small subunit
MSYRVLLFGAEAAAAGARAVELEVAEPEITADALIELLTSAYPSLSGIPTCRVAVNQRFVDGDAKVTADDEIALVGPVSGG